LEPPVFGFPENQLIGFKRWVIVFRGGGAVSVTTGSGAEFKVLTVGAISGGGCAMAGGAEIRAGAGAVAGGGVETGAGAGMTALTGGDSAGSGFGVAATGLEGVKITLADEGAGPGVGAGAGGRVGAVSGVKIIRCFKSNSCASFATSLV
jgi:hypothetical protein